MSRSSVPRCRVVRALDIEGPKGGNIRVLELACGSRTWTRGVRATKPPPALAACTSCYVLRELRRIDAMSDNGPTFVKPTVGRMVHYFDRMSHPSRPWAAVVTFVRERERDERGDELGPWVCDLHVMPPGGSAFNAIAPLEGCYDAGDLENHPEWSGGWNWPPRVLPE